MTDYYVPTFTDDAAVEEGSEMASCPHCGCLLPEPEMRQAHGYEPYPQASPSEYEPVEETVKCPRCGKEVPTT